MLKSPLIILSSAILLTACTHQVITKSNPTPQPTALTTPSPSAMVKTYTLDEISTHNNPEDCWFTISGKVYNATGFDTKHPGGKAVYQGCGKDATTLFETRPMGSKTPHSAKARELMVNFEIGTLSQ